MLRFLHGQPPTFQSTLSPAGHLIWEIPNGNSKIFSLVLLNVAKQLSLHNFTHGCVQHHFIIVSYRVLALRDVKGVYL